jgi:predicted ATP-binding protein involved in virulence
MQIDSIRIIDFRGITDKEFSFDPHFNVLIGENGSGKTSVLEALAAALNPYVAISQGKNVRPIRKEDVRIEDFGPSIEKKIKTSLIVQGKVVDNPIQWEIKKSHFDWGFMQSEDQDLRTISKSHFSILSENGGKNLILPVFDYLGCGRLFSEPSKSVKTLPKGSRYEGYYNCLDSTSSIKRFASWFKTMELSKLQGNEIAIWRVQVIKDVVKNCLDGWETIFFDINEDQLMARRLSQRHEVLPFSYLSDGQRNIIGMVADIAYRCILLNPYLEMNAAKESPGIVLIDELDLHLHPKWQRTIVQKLKDTFPKIQFITTTHSPFIVQSLKNDELIDLQGKKIADDYRKIGVEDITEREMGVEHVIRSSHFLEMQKVADEYYNLVSAGKETTDKHKIDEIKRSWSS